MDKIYAKGGIYRLFGYDQHLIVPFYQSLKLLNLSFEFNKFEKTLISISEIGFKELYEKESQKKIFFYLINIVKRIFYLILIPILI